MKLQFRKTMLRLAALVALLGIIFLPGRENVAYAEGTDAGGTRAEAMEIQVNQTYSEVISSDDDEDYFKFSTTARGYFQVTFEHNAGDQNDVRSGWDVRVLDESGEVLTSKSEIKTSWTSVTLPYAAPGRIFYVQVLPHFYPTQGALDCIYDLNVIQTAAPDWEAEPNETIGVANVIDVGKTYHGMLLNGSDTDYFRFTTAVRGYFRVQFAHNLADNHSVESGWNVRVLDESGEVLTSGSEIKKNWMSVTLPYAAPGKTFYVQIWPHTYPTQGALHCTYDLNVTQTAAPDWEAEPNGTLSNANAIATGKTYHGMLLNDSDTDYFRFTTAVRGYFRVQFAHNLADNYSVQSGWDVRVLDESGEVLASGSEIEKNWTSVTLPYAVPGKTFYVKILPHTYPTQGALHCTYDLTVTQTAVSDWELEPNGTTAAATSIVTGRTYNGITLSWSDQDYYKVKVTSDGKLKVKLKSSPSNNSGKIETGWAVYVYDKKLNEVAKINRITTENEISLDVKKGNYYIRVLPERSDSAPTSCQYSITTTHAKAPSKPKISSVKAAKRAATVKWKKVSGASGYYIYRSTSKNGEYKKVKTIKKGSAVSWKNKKLTSRQKYYYKVAAYKKSNGMTAVSSYSKVKSVKVK